MSANDGGPAFPARTSNGLTLRDYFAASAFGFLAHVQFARGTGPQEIGPIENIAKTAYQIADAMLAERAK